LVDPAGVGKRTERIKKVEAEVAEAGKRRKHRPGKSETAKKEGTGSLLDCQGRNFLVIERSNRNVHLHEYFR
jgi:hypothetical protein